MQNYQFGDMENWSLDDVRLWLIDNEFGIYTQLLCDIHRLDGRTLLCLTENDLKGPPIRMKVLGDIKRLILCLNQAKLQYSSAVHAVTRHKRSDRVSRTYTSLNGVSQRAYERHTSVVESADVDSELWKTALSFVYSSLVFLLTSLVMVIVHDRVPDMEKYPPLPDIFLDNIPYIPWAFDAGEVVGVIMGLIWTMILVFHKHRFILMRRMWSLAGTIFLLRCVTMLITSLSVPGRHLQCEARASGTLWEQFQKALIICEGMGMSSAGVRSCGDYMFSGHTVVLTMFNFFITEYTPRSMSGLHTATWVMNLFGIFFILSAHEHYSIDVFVAFYITSRLFLYYHTLANNRSNFTNDRKRARVWFPLFYFFESKCSGAVPNEFEWPLPWPRTLKLLIEQAANRE